jgi:hypothetical protein
MEDYFAGRYDHSVRRSDHGTLPAESLERRSSSSINEASSNERAESSAGIVSNSRDTSVNRSLSGSFNASVRVAFNVNGMAVTEAPLAFQPSP